MDELTSLDALVDRSTVDKRSLDDLTRKAEAEPITPIRIRSHQIPGHELASDRTSPTTEYHVNWFTILDDRSCHLQTS